MLAHFTAFVNNFLPKICHFKQTVFVFCLFLQFFLCFCTMSNKKAEFWDHFKPVCSAYFMLVKFLRLEILENYYIKALVIRALFIVCTAYSPGKKRGVKQLFHKSYRKGILYLLMIEGNKVRAAKEIEHKIFKESV